MRFDERSQPGSFESLHWMGYRLADSRVLIELSGVVLINFKGTGGTWRYERLEAYPRLDRAFGQLGLQPPGQGYYWTMSPRMWTVFAAPVALANDGQAVNAGWAVDRFYTPINAQYKLANSFPLYADLGVRDADGILWRLGYHIRCLGEMRQEREVPV